MNRIRKQFIIIIQIELNLYMLMIIIKMDCTLLRPARFGNFEFSVRALAASSYRLSPSTHQSPQRSLF